MVMINQFDLIGDTDIDDPSLIALARKKAAAAAAAAAEAAAAAADAAADDTDAPELPVEETQKGVLAVPHGGEPYQDLRGQDYWRGQGYGYGRGQDYWGAQNGRGQEWRGQDGPGRGQDGFSAVPEDSAQELPGKPSIRGHSDQPYRSRDGGRRGGYLNRDDGEYAIRDGGRRGGYLNRDNGEYASRDGGRRGGYLNRDNGEYASRDGGRGGYLNRDNGEYDSRDARSGFSSPHAAPLVKEVDKLPEQNLEENVTLEGKSLIPKENVPSSNAFNKDKQGMVNGREEKEPRVKVMTLEEYQKVLEEKRRTLVAMKKTQERKVDVDKEFESMQQLVVKKENNEFFIKLGNDKEAGKRKEDTDGDERVKKDSTDRVERVKKSVSMDEFLKLAEKRRGGYRGGGRGYRGGGRGGYRGGGRGGYRDGRGYSSLFSAESIQDARQFPVLGGKEVEQQHSSAAQGKKVEQHSSAQQGKKVEQQHSSAAQGKKVEQT